MRDIDQIAQDIRREWGNKLSPYAKPYLEAMLCVSKPTDMYGADNAESIILYFLSNASGFRGGNAVALKAELKEIVKIKAAR